MRCTHAPISMSVSLDLKAGWALKPSCRDPAEWFSPFVGEKNAASWTVHELGMSSQVGKWIHYILRHLSLYQSNSKWTLLTDFCNVPNITKNMSHWGATGLYNKNHNWKAFVHQQQTQRCCRSCAGVVIQWVTQFIHSSGGMSLYMKSYETQCICISLWHVNLQ